MLKVPFKPDDMFLILWIRLPQLLEDIHLLEAIFSTVQI